MAEPTHCPITGARYRLWIPYVAKSAPATTGAKRRKNRKTGIKSADHKLRQSLIRKPNDAHKFRPIQYPTLNPIRHRTNFLLDKYYQLKRTIGFGFNKLDKLEEEISENIGNRKQIRDLNIKYNPRFFKFLLRR
eukprot:366787_1